MSILHDGRTIPVSGIIVAAGKGQRMGTIPKHLITLGGKTLVEIVYEAYARSCVDEIIIVCSDIEAVKGVLNVQGEKKVVYVQGGKTRTESVFNGVNAAGRDNRILSVHDCARPFVTADMINDVAVAAMETGASSASCRVTDTVKFVSDDYIYTPDRASLRAVQTPQCFLKSLYMSAFAAAATSGKVYTDETTMVEALGKKVTYLDTSPSNIKLTTPEDIKTAKAIFYLLEKGDM